MRVYNFVSSLVIMVHTTHNHHGVAGGGEEEVAVRDADDGIRCERHSQAMGAPARDS